ncbi:MAG: flavin-dependent oxidoreductase [Burkholderiaceae bacterium]
MKVMIAGGGIGGLTTAMALHRKGFDVTVFEQVPEIRALGVGINILPHAVGVLAEFGLLDALLATGLDAKEYIFMNRHGQPILADARGRSAGYAYPQISIHRGELQMVLLNAATRMLGADRIRTSSRLARFEERGDRVHASFVDRYGKPSGEFDADVLIAADGIHSMVRAHFYPDEGMPKWNGVTIWRGTTVGKPFLSGSSIVKAGWTAQKFICYPISKKHADQGLALINWIADLHSDDKTLLEREDWNRPGRLEDFLPKFESWKFPFMDVPWVIRNADSIFEFPMVDRDPVERWSFGRVTLLGDAAHPMYPIASNGATQAILDAQTIAQSLSEIADPVAALRDYEAKRLPQAAQIVRMNRQQGPDVILDIVHERAPDGFASIDDVVPRAELLDIVGRYKTAAGHRQDASPAESAAR